jgi:DNA-binding response OmpR family regulator
MAIKATLLIVDREKILVDLLTRALSSPELIVLGATTAEEAVQLIDLNDPDLIVIDPSLPNGMPLISSMRSAPSKPKIVAFTNSGEFAQRARLLGVEDVVDRNSGFDALVAAVRKHAVTDLPQLQPQGGVHVLVADDEDDLRQVLSSFLSSQGYSISFAQTGREAIQAVESDPSIQVVLLDVSMPEMGGMEALRVITSRDGAPNVIMMTAVADRDVARQAMKAGAFDYILKPFDFPLIEASITACLSHSEFQKQPWWKRLTRRS